MKASKEDRKVVAVVTIINILVVAVMFYIVSNL